MYLPNANRFLVKAKLDKWLTSREVSNLVSIRRLWWSHYIFELQWLPCIVPWDSTIVPSRWYTQPIVSRKRLPFEYPCTTEITMLSSLSSLCPLEPLIQRKNETNGSSDLFSGLPATLLPVKKRRVTLKDSSGLFELIFCRDDWLHWQFMLKSLTSWWWARNLKGGKWYVLYSPYSTPNYSSGSNEKTSGSGGKKRKKIIRKKKEHKTWAAAGCPFESELEPLAPELGLVSFDYSDA